MTASIALLRSIVGDVVIDDACSFVLVVKYSNILGNIPPKTTYATPSNGGTVQLEQNKYGSSALKNSANVVDGRSIDIGRTLYFNKH
jgi:hypothetical protein